MDDNSPYSEPVVNWKALASRVLVVSVPGQIGDWAVYIDAVPGKSHDHEWMEVAKHGDKLPKNIACVIFPKFDPKMYREA